MILLLALLACGTSKAPTEGATDRDADGVPDRVDCAPDDPSVHPGAAEVCDGFDQDCDGDADEGLPHATAYADLDGDTFGDVRTALDGCAPPAGYVTASGDCDDTRADVYPGAAEACDGVDHDCDGATMDVVEGGGWRDGDGDGYGGEPVSGCPGSPGVAAEGGDCDDASTSVHPGAPETCEGRGRDEDCDGLVDDADPDVTDASPWSPDGDADGYGDPAGEVTWACDAPAGEVLDATDCDDADPAVHPWADEPACTDGIDYNCDGVAIDADEDEDGWGDCDDCEEWDAAVNPGATEICDELDNNCDGNVDEGLTVPTWYEDHDGDGYGLADVWVTACQEPERSASVAGDCDDLLASVHPGARESCRTTSDDDCDGSANDVGASYCTYFYADADGDGSGDSADRSCQCAPDERWPATTTDDCDDADPAVFPNAIDACDDGIDSNCDGFEGCSQADLPPVVGGTSAADRFGDEVVLGPDLDGDGVDDLAVSAPGAGNGEVVFYAGPIGPAAPPVLARWTGGRAASYRGVGSQIAFGDDDGDGNVDVIVGDGAYSTSSLGEYGMVAILRGPLAASGSVGPDADARFFGDYSGGSTGDAVAWAGDLAGDGVARIAVGDSRTAGLRAGAVYLLPTGVLGDRHSADVADVIAADTGTSVGATIQAGSDLDGDGLADLVAGYSSGALVFFGPVSGVRPSSTADLVIIDSMPYAQRILDDIDGDGVSDLLLRMSSTLRVYTGLASGSMTTIDARFTLVDGTTADSTTDAPAVADLDGDGQPDLAYGRPSLDARDGNEGAVYAVLGPLLGSADVDDAQVWIGSSGSAYLGMGLQTLGDVDADGRDDVLVTARRGPLQGADQGDLHLLLGAYVH